jgi:hypothetical protein
MMVGTSTSIALCRVFAGAFADTLQGVCRAFAGKLGTWHEHAILDDRADLHTAKTQGVLPCRTPMWVGRALPCGSVVRCHVGRSCVAMWVGRAFFGCLSARLGPALRCRRLFELMRCDDSVHEVAARRDDDVPEATLSDSRLKYPA